MSTQPSTIVQRVWNYFNVLRDDGISYGDYVEQLTYLLFLKMDYGGVSMLGKKSAIPARHNWASLLSKDGEEQRRTMAEKERRLSVAREAPYGDGIESAVEGALVRAGRLRQAVLKSAFEGRL